MLSCLVFIVFLQLLLNAGKMKTIFCVFALFFGTHAAKVNLSELIPICDAKDQNLNTCVVKSANLLIPHLTKGIKSYGFPPLDPLRVARMDVGQDNGPVTLKLELIDTNHLGLSTLNFRSASIDTKRNRWVLNGTLPYYSLAGRYKGTGRILLVPIIGDGKANFTFNNIGVDFVINGAPKKEKSNTYFDLTSLKVYFKFNKSYVSLSNLFGGNKLLGARTNTFLNENSDEVVKGLSSTLEDVYSALYTNLVKRIMSNVPYDQLFKNV